jgi:hypothetical protein
MNIAGEIERRNAATVKILAVLTEHPGRWIHWRRFAQFSACAWRTRLSDARKQLRLGPTPGVVQWNKRIHRSAYRYLPYQPLGREASEPVSQRSLF